MGVWTSIKKRVFRSESQRLNSGSTSDETQPLTFVSDLVSGEFTNKTLWKNLLKVAWEDPIMNRICVQLSENVYDDWFVVVNDDEEREPHTKNDQIQKEFTGMNAKHHFTQALIGERIFGHSALVFNYNKHRADVIGEGYQVATLDVFTLENMVIPRQAFFNEEGEVLDEPAYVTVNPNPLLIAEEDNINWDDLLWFCTRPKGRTFYGYTAMMSVWDNATYLRESIDAMAWSHKKWSLGVWMWYIIGGLTDTDYADFEETVQNMSSRRAIVAETSEIDRVEWVGPASTGTDAIVTGADFLLGLISSGSGIPKDIFTGLSAGAITGSEINNKALFATISRIQSTMEPYVLAVIEKMGYDIKDMAIEWNTRYATDELEQAQIELMQAQAAQMRASTENMEKMTAEGRGPNDIGIGIKEDKDPKKEGNPTGQQS